MDKEVVLTGLRANNELTLGNYLGAMLPIIKFANQHSSGYQINMFMPDLHTITVENDYAQLQSQIFHCLYQYVAAGLNIAADNIFLYRQSYISAHAEMAWLLECFTGFGEASRMVEFKDKSQQIGVDRVSAGLFNYPMLMAADILLYGAKWVPVGEDQRQHLELTRVLAERLNNRFGKLFIVPAAINDQVKFFGLSAPLRIRSLKDPTKKMSKSISDPSGTILLVDKPSDAAQKIMTATTDSLNKIKFDFDRQPGISNLLQILAALQGLDQATVNQVWEGRSQYSALKQTVAEVVVAFLSDFQSKYQLVNQAQISAKLTNSEAKMRMVANKQLLKVQTEVGLRPVR